MRLKIKDIAIIQSGVYLKESTIGEVIYLQVKNFTENGMLLSHLPSIVLNDKVKKYLLSENDLLFAAKGFVNFCTVVKEEWGDSVASTSFLVLKIKDKTKILPEYVCWFLNRNDVRTFFRSITAGSVLPSVTKTMMEDFEMDVPDVLLQEKIVAIAALQQRELILSNRIMKLKNKLIEKQLIKKIDAK
jgi:restriction endonuclease S subunit